jgi:hypothetical protein
MPIQNEFREATLSLAPKCKGGFCEPPWRRLGLGLRGVALLG